MISRDRWGLRFPDICLTVEEKSQKKVQLGTLTRQRIESGPHQVRGNEVTPRLQWWSITEINEEQYKMLIWGRDLPL